ncbi:MAG: hypothetical protein AAB772_00665 [Patescibacteria group bacterium]
MKKLFWTQHSYDKMRFYRLSESRVQRVINSPNRIEFGIVPDTIVMMQAVKGSRKKSEIWVMVQDEKNKRKIISAWRYPGVTKAGEPLPREILREIKGIL